MNVNVGVSWCYYGDTRHQDDGDINTVRSQESTHISLPNSAAEIQLRPPRAARSFIKKSPMQ